jgi:hypothetical protein
MSLQRISDLTAGTPPYSGASIIEVSVPTGAAPPYASRKAQLSDIVGAYLPLTGGLLSGALGIKTTTLLADLHIGQSAPATARSYHTMSDANNGEWAYLGDWLGNVARYGTDKNGSGVARDIYLMRGGMPQLSIANGFGTTAYIGINTTAPGCMLDVVVPSDASGTIRIGNPLIGAGASCGATVEATGVRGDANGTFDGRIAIGFRRTDGNPIDNAYIGRVGTLGFGGQWGTDQTFQQTKMLYPASIQGLVEGSYTAANNMPTALSFRTGLVGEDIRAPNTSFGTERIRITSGGNVGFGTSIPQALLHIGTTAATARTYNTFTDASNGEWAYMGDWSTNTAKYGTDKNGSGIARNVQFMVGGVDKLNYGVSLANYWAASSPLHIYGFDAASGAALVLGNNGGANSYIGGSWFSFNTYWNGSSYVFGQGSHAGTPYGGLYVFDPPTGVHRWSITDAGGAAGAATSAVTALALKRIAGVSLLTIGTWVDFTAAFPALRANGNSLEVRLADDSAYAQFRASILYGDTLGGNAMAFAQAQWTMSGGGAITWSGNRLYWNARLIWIPISQPYGTFTQADLPTTDIPPSQVYDGVARSVAGGILLNAWEALYWDPTIGNFHIVFYGNPWTVQSSWLLVASVNGDSTLLKLGTGQQIANPGSITNGYENKYIWNSGGAPQPVSISVTGGSMRNYKTYTDASNAEWSILGSWGSNVAYYGTSMIGSGVARDVAIQRGGLNQMLINGALIAYGPAAAFTSSFPALKRVGTSLQLRLADDSADAPFYSSTIYSSGDLSATGAVFAVGYTARAGTPGPNRGNRFNIDWAPGAQLWIDNVNQGTFTLTCDYRIKENIAELPSTWDKVKALHPVSYSYAANPELLRNEADPAERWGFIAHELQEVLLPTAATGYKDAPNLIQSPDILAVAASLTKALQEAMARIEALEAR